MQKARPLSPHLQVYKLPLSANLSILHRGTGVFLSIGLLLLVCWVASIADGRDAYTAFQGFAGHWLVRLMLVGWTFALFYHLCNGIRHLYWDIGRGYEIAALNKSGWLAVIVATLLTVATVVIAWQKSGGAL